MVASRTTGRRFTPLIKAIASDPIRTVTMATKFPPEFLQELEEQTVMSGMGGGLDSKPTGDHHQETRAAPVTTEFPQPGGFQDLLNAEFPETTALDATTVRI
jgi:hypothetical protein